MARATRGQPERPCPLGAGDAEPGALEESAPPCGSPGSIRQIEARALCKLRHLSLDTGARELLFG